MMLPSGGASVLLYSTKLGRARMSGHCASVGVPRAAKTLESTSRSLVPMNHGRLSSNSAGNQWQGVVQPVIIQSRAELAHVCAEDC